MIANRIHYIIFILFQFLQLILLVLYTKVNDSMVKPVLCIFIAISSLNFYLSRIIFKDSKNIYEKWILSSIFKYIFIVLIYYFCRQLIPFLIFFQNYATIIIFLVLDILRVSFIFYVRTNYESKITSYYFIDLIKLELFIQMVENSSDTSGSKLKSYEPNIYSFHENGKPKSIDLHDFFDKLVEPNEDIIFCFNRYVKNKIKFEKGHGSMITILNEEEFSAVDNKKDPNKKELRKDVFIRCFNVCGMFFFNSISYRRSENTLDFETFSENMNEICKERENLYDSIDKMFQLLEKVKFFSYFFEFILFISLMILFPSSGTLIFVFLISFCIYLIRPSIGRLAEASFFILISNPFNVNDRIKIKNEVYLVRDISLISTKLQKWCGEVTFFDNEKLSKEAIFNIMRSVSQIWEVKILVTKDIDMQSFDKFRKDLKSFCNCSNSIISIKVNFNEIINSNYLKIIFHVKHTMNYQNPFFMWVNQNKFMNYLFSSLEDYKIKYLPMDREVMVLNDT